VDRDIATAPAVRRVLASEGWQVEYALPGQDTLRRILIEYPDLVVLGIGPEDGDWHFCRKLVIILNQPLLCLLDAGSGLDPIKCLELGADDCIVKPVFFPELVARARALLRRKTPAATIQDQGLYRDADLFVNLGRKEVRLNDQRLALTPTEFRLLACFVQNAGQVLSSDRLLAEVWGLRQGKDSGLVKQYVHHLRKKIERDPRQPCHIVTERGLGYRFRFRDGP
jgi:two-component system KDP operon response regulator KdpE